MEIFSGISLERLDEILNAIQNVKAVLIGDICLDVYWKADMTKSELSRETPHFPLPVVKEWMSPGGAGNVAANIAALRPKSVKLIGVIGRDWRGDALNRKLQEAGIDICGVVISDTAVTNAYCKPLREGISNVEYEDPRLDFINYEYLRREDEINLLNLLEQYICGADILCVSDQLLYGCITPLIREKIILIAKAGIKVIVDSRDRIGLYKGVTLKPNEVEGARAVYNSTGYVASLENYAHIAKNLAVSNQSDVCMTLGSKGCIYADSKTVIHIPPCEVTPPIDICGAGDTFLAAYSCAIAAGAKPWETAYIANLAAAVTIAKVKITGTATPEEIRKRYSNTG